MLLWLLRKYSLVLNRCMRTDNFRLKKYFHRKLIINECLISYIEYQVISCLPGIPIEIYNQKVESFLSKKQRLNQKESSIVYKSYVKYSRLGLL